MSTEPFRRITKAGTPLHKKHLNYTDYTRLGHVIQRALIHPMACKT